MSSKPMKVWIQQEHPYRGWFIYSDMFGLHTHRLTKRGALKFAKRFINSWHPTIYNKEIVWELEQTVKGKN